MKKLDKKANLYVFLNRTVVGLIVYGIFAFILISPRSEYQPEFIKDIIIIIGAITVFIVLVSHLVLPFFTYRLYGYLVSEDEVVIKKGVLFKKEIILPIKRIQHVEKLQGPIQLLIGHATVRIFTAGSVETIIGLDSLVASELVENLNSHLNRYLENEEESDE